MRWTASDFSRSYVSQDHILFRIYSYTVHKYMKHFTCNVTEVTAITFINYSKDTLASDTKTRDTLASDTKTRDTLASDTKTRDIKWS